MFDIKVIVEHMMKGFRDSITRAAKNECDETFHIRLVECALCKGTGVDTTEFSDARIDRRDCEFRRRIVEDNIITSYVYFFRELGIACSRCDGSGRIMNWRENPSHVTDNEIAKLAFDALMGCEQKNE